MSFVFGNTFVCRSADAAKAVRVLIRMSGWVCVCVCVCLCLCVCVCVCVCILCGFVHRVCLLVLGNENV
jgi:hypothetical protein